MGATGNEPVILPKDIRYRNNIGQRAELSFGDLLTINKVYCRGRQGDTLTQSIHTHTHTQAHLHIYIIRTYIHRPNIHSQISINH